MAKKRAICWTLGFLALVGLLVTPSISMPSRAGAPVPPEVRYAGESLPFMPGAGEAMPRTEEPEEGSWDKTVYAYWDGSDWEIVARPGGQLTDDPWNNTTPALSRGGDEVVYWSDRTGRGDLYVLNLKSGTTRQLTSSPTSETFPAWSPDGKKVAYQALEGENWDIYVVNADGTGRTRLTTHPAYDGQPTWSPDGRWIAFVSNRTGAYELFLMRAGGGDTHQLTAGMAMVSHPRWSPEGRQIAFDCDGDANGFQELFVLTFEPQDPFDPGTPWPSRRYSVKRLLYPPAAETDLWLGSWSADGERLIYSVIKWVQYRGVWYIETTSIYSTRLDWPGHERFIAGDRNIYPHQATLDTWAPKPIRVEPVPAISPSPISLRWSTTDQGAAGLRGYDVEYRVDEGDWTAWLQQTNETSAEFRDARAGHRYRFRWRACDRAWNCLAFPPQPQVDTVIETFPPITRMLPGPPFTSGQIKVQWSVQDPGGSGCATSDVDFQEEGTDTWAPWVRGHPWTWGLFGPGQPGHTYCWRARATDNAGNTGEWSSERRCTLQCRHILLGQVYDNRAWPLAGAVGRTKPAAFVTVPSDDQGGYTLCVGDLDEQTVTLEMPGYRSETSGFMTVTDIQIYVPGLNLMPADNLIPDPGFEAGPPETSGWHLSGETPPTWFGYDAFRGQHSASLGSPPFWPVPVLASAPDMGAAAMLADRTGTLHLFWSRDKEGQVYYSTKAEGGDWSHPTVIVEEMSGGYTMEFDAGGTLHLVYGARGARPGATDLFYLRKPPGQPWRTAQRITTSSPGTIVKHPQLAVGPDGTLHLIWTETPPDTWSMLRYAYRTTDGRWTVREAPLFSRYAGTQQDIAVTGDGTVHVIGLPGGYLLKPQGQPWKEGPPPVPQPRFKGVYEARFVLSPEGRLTLVFTSYDVVNVANPLCQMELLPDGTWGRARILLGDLGSLGSGPVVVYDEAGGLHAAWTRFISPRKEIHYAYRPSGAVDCLVNHRVPGVWGGGWFGATLAVTQSGAHLAWTNWADLHYLGPYTGMETGGNSSLTQQLDLSPLYQPTASFWYRAESGGTSADRLEILVDDGISVTRVFSTTAAPQDWTFAWADLSRWAGQTVTVTFNLASVADHVPTTVFLDGVSLGSAYPDLWAGAAQEAWGAPKAVLTYRLAYGNRGSVPSVGTVLTHTLPAGLTFVGAEPAPNLVDGSLVWALGDLASGASGEVQVAVALPPDAAPGVPFTATVHIGSAAPEVHLANNQGVVAVQATYRHPLPLLLKASR